MNTGLLINTFVGNVGVCLPPPKNAGQFSQRPFCKTSENANPPEASADNPFPTALPKTTTTDKMPIDAQSTPANKRPEEFRHTFQEKTMTEEPQKGQAGTGSNEKNAAFALPVQPSIVQSWLALYSQMVEHGKEGVARTVESKAGYELAQLLTDLKPRKNPAVIGRTAKPAGTEPLLSLNKSQFGLEGVLLFTSRSTLGAGTKPDEGKISGEAQISNRTFIPSKGLIDVESGKKLIPQALTANGKTITNGEKQRMVVNPDVSGGQKAPILKHDFPVVQEKSAELQLKASFNSIVEKPTSNKGDVFQQNQVPVLENAAKGDSGQVLSESLAVSAKEQSGNPLGDSLLHKLNTAQVRIFTDETKNGGSSTSNSGSNFEQMLSPNNAQSPVAEQPLVFTPTAKTADNASPSYVSLSIGEQIQNSINSSLRQGDQQITVLLNPPELGKVCMKFQEHGDQITALLEVDKAQTRYEIQQALPQIVRNLADSGIQIKRLEVVLADQMEQQPYKDQLLQDGWYEQQAGAEGSNPNPFGTNEWLTNDSTYSGFPEREEMLITDDSVNMLI